METAVYTVLILAIVYLVAGLLFAIYFLTGGIEKVDVSAHGSGWGFRFMILPGTIVFWPVLLKKVIKAKKKDYDEAAS